MKNYHLPKFSFAAQMKNYHSPTFCFAAEEECVTDEVHRSALVGGTSRAGIDICQP